MPNNQPFLMMNEKGDYKSFDFSPWGGIDGFLEASKTQGANSSLVNLIPDLYRARDMTATAIATMPFEICNDSEEVIDASDDWTDILGGLPNPQRTLYLIASSLCGGSAYLRPDATSRMVIDLQYCAPTTIIPWIDLNGLQYFERVTQQGKSERLMPDELIYFWLPDANVEIGPAAAHPMGTATQSALLSYGMATSLTKIAERGFIPPTLLAITGMVNPTDRDKTEKWYNSWLRGAFTQIAKIINGEKMDVKQVGAGMEQLKGTYVELKRHVKEDIAQAFGIPSALFMSDNAFASEYDALIKQWYSSSIFTTIYHTIEEVLTDQYLNRYAKDSKYYWRFKPEYLNAFQADESARSASVNTLTQALDKSPELAAWVMEYVLGYDLSEEAEADLTAIIAQKKADAQAVQQQMTNAQPGTQDMPAEPADPSDPPSPEDVPPAKAIHLTAPMIKDLEAWSGRALAWYKKGKGKAEDWECKALPDDIADGIRARLRAAKNELDIVKAFEISNTSKPRAVKSEALVLADAINNYVSNQEPAREAAAPIYIKTDALTMHEETDMTAITKALDSLKSQNIVVNVPQQPAPNVNVNVPQQPAPVVNVTNEVKPADTVINNAPAKPVKVKITRDYRGDITGAEAE